MCGHGKKGVAIDSLSAYVALGNVAIDDLVYADGTTTWAVPGGGAMYAALGMAVWTGTAAVTAPLGPDFPHREFSAVALRRCRPIVHTMRNWGLYEDDGSRHFVSRRHSLPWEAFSPHVEDLDDGPYSFCHIAPLPRGHVVSLIHALRERGARVISLDMHDRELATIGQGDLLRLLAGVDVFLPSAQDIDVLFPGRPPLDALRALRASAPALPAIVVKCGADGALVHGAGSPEVITVPALRTAVRDATGAGDAFCGGFLTGFASTGDLVEAALRGAVSASYAVAAVGPSGLVDVPAADARSRCAALRERIARVALAAP